MRILAGIGALAIVIAVGAAVFFFGGFFNVAASEPDPEIVNWVLSTFFISRTGTRSIQSFGRRSYFSGVTVFDDGADPRLSLCIFSS